MNTMKDNDKIAMKECRECFEKWINTSEGYGLAFASDCWNESWQAAMRTQRTENPTGAHADCNEKAAEDIFGDDAGTPHRESD